MTPEQDIAQVVGTVCPDCGHWPYTRDSGLYVGWRPGDDGPFTFARNTPVRVQIVYDLVICCDRARLADAETLRYQLYAALRDADWRLEGIPGPETYNAQTRMYLWPVSARKTFAIDENGMPAVIQ